jgi:hypothetical protein
MLQIVLLAGKFILLIILYLFIYRVVRSTTRELRMSAAVGGGQTVVRPHDSRGTEVGHAHPGAPPSASGIVTWSLVVIKSPSLRTGEAFAFPPGSSAVVGRDPEMDISLDDTFVSSKHAVFEATAGVLQIEDLHSTNGTLVNGQAISGTHELHTGDRLEIGDTIFQVEVR